MNGLETSRGKVAVFTRFLINKKSKNMKNKKCVCEQLQPFSIIRVDEDGNCVECGKAYANMRKFESGATRNSDESKLDFEGFLSPTALEHFAEYMNKNRVQADGNIRDSDNWQKGIPLDSYMKSMFRHFFDVWKAHRGLETPEDMITNLSALMFNVQGYLHEYDKLTKKK